MVLNTLADKELKLVRSRKVTVDDLQKGLEALAVCAGTHQDRNNGAIYNMFPQSALDFFQCKLLAGEITLHVLLTGLCHCL